MTVLATILAQQFSGAFFVVWVVFFSGGYFLGGITTIGYLKILLWPFRIVIILGAGFIIINSWQGLMQGLYSPWTGFYAGLVGGSSRAYRYFED